MELCFKGGSELIKLILDRETKDASIASSKTGYKITPIKWRMLFDKGKEEQQEKITDTLTDDEFKQIINIDMQKKGYVLINDISSSR